jgi:hypothetical protein
VAADLTRISQTTEHKSRGQKKSPGLRGLP